MNISVIIPAYNRCDLLARAVNSVLKQTIPIYEIVIIDDCSTDNTLVVVNNLQRLYPDLRIIYHRHEVNKGESGARNSGLSLATGDYFAFLDSDDEWLEEKLEEQFNFINDHPELDGLVSEYYLVDEFGNRTHIRYKDQRIDPAAILSGGTGFCLGSSLLMNNRISIEQYDEDLKLFADTDWIYRMSRRYRIGVLNKPHALYYKAPMRTGDHVKQCAEVYYKKYRDFLMGQSYIVRAKFKAYIYISIALAYHAHRDKKLALRYYRKSLLNQPFRGLKLYCNVLMLLMSYCMEYVSVSFR